MNEIKCPHCGKFFQVDESGYAQIVKQVRDSEFNKELESRANELSKLTEAKCLHENEKNILKKNEELSKKDAEIAELRTKLENGENDKKLAVNDAVQIKDNEISKKNEELAKKETEIAELRAKIENGENDKKLAVNDAVQVKEQELAKKETEIAKLRVKLDSVEREKKSAVNEAVLLKEKELSEKAAEIVELQGQLKTNEAENRMEIQTLKATHNAELQAKDELINFYKDFKTKQSTKMIGESLEQHCLAQFNQIRMTAFPDAYFEKDNDASGGSKGDFIYRESYEGTEFISIMFEMKNEMDTTATKHKNEDFFAKLDKDRRAKKCEYAVLVSMLEADNELYNSGIVDVSYHYEKMYVIRPQFFISMITLLRNAAKNTLQYRKELERIQSQQMDISQFENNMLDFKEAFGKNFKLASDKFYNAIAEIDKSIDHLQKVKAALTSSERQLRLANDKAQDLSIRKLTKNAPSVRAMFEEQKNITEISEITD